MKLNDVKVIFNPKGKLKVIFNQKSEVREINTVTESAASQAHKLYYINVFAMWLR